MQLSTDVLGILIKSTNIEENILTKIRGLFTTEEISSAVSSSAGNLTKAAAMLSEDSGTHVSRQLLRYWVSCLETELPDTMERAAELTRNYTLGTRNNKLNRDIKAVIQENERLREFRALIKSMNIAPAPTTTRYTGVGGKPMTVEALFSDLQIGKLSGNYNSKVAARRVRAYGDALVQKIKQHMHSGYEVELIKLVVLGDVIESDKKHANSARGCDIGTAEQMRWATELMVHLIGQLVGTGVKVQVVMVTGNHDHDGHGLSSYMPGQEHLSWPMYHATKLISEARFGEAVEFVIPKGAFHLENIYGQNVLYEHGCGVASSQAGMEKRRDQRAQQLGKHISMYRQGDKHNICRFNNDRLITNGAFFGSDSIGGEYSSILGYQNEPSQLILFHVPRAPNDPRSTVFDTFTIQLGHIS